MEFWRLVRRLLKLYRQEMVGWGESEKWLMWAVFLKSAGIADG